MSTRPRTLPEIRAEGYRALVERLGVADALRFMQQYDLGQGDYTKERHQWLDKLTLDDIVSDIKRLRVRRGAKSTTTPRRASSRRTPGTQVSKRRRKN